MASALEASLGRHRAWSLAALVLLVVLAWGWLLAGAGTGMRPVVSLAPPLGSDIAMADMAMMDPVPWGAGRLLLTFAMWWTMMAAMMLPSAAPMILLYASAAAAQTASRPATAAFLGGYLAAWGAFSLLATGLQVLLDRTGLIGAMSMGVRGRWLAAAILVAAGLYQFGAVKDVCLRHCRNPAQFLARHYRPGWSGALWMGLRHGAFCLGCCGVLMALLFVGGAMNLAWIALLTLMVAAEKLLPHGRAVGLAAGWACLAGAAALLLT
jgi:predicted metal-binding membrane protein